MNRDIVCGCGTFVFAVAYYLTAAAIPESMLADAVGPQGLPEAYGITLAILSLLLVGSGLMKWRKEHADGADAPQAKSGRRDWEDARRAFGVLALGAGYVVILPWAGYVVSIALLIVAVAWYQERAFMRWLVPTAIAGALGFWVIFVEVLEIAEPAGLWPHFI
jgi:hypothetical protein